jgi:aspartate ammonia-lyase
VSGLEVNEERCRENIEKSLALITALVPVIGYDAAARLAKKAEATGRTVRAVAEEEAGLPREQLNALLDAANQLAPGLSEAEPAV